MSGPKITATELLGRKVSAFENIASRQGSHPLRHNPVAQFLDEIRNGDYKEKVALLRAAIAAGDEAKARSLKLKLPAITWGGQFTKRNAESLGRHSGIILLDFDRVPDPAALKAGLARDGHILAAWISPSGRGIHALAAGTVTDKAGHKEQFLGAADHFRRKLDAELDPACKDVCRVLFVSNDPKMYVAEGELEAFGCADEAHPPSSILSTLSASSTSSTSPAYSTYSTSHVSLEGVRARVRHQEELKTHHAGKWWRIYEQYFDARHAGAGERNKWIVSTVPSAYCVVAEGVLLRLCLYFYDMNAGLFSTPRDEHEKEVRAMIEARARSYRAELPEGERALYDELEGPTRSAYRICRDLARVAMKKAATPTFTMSACELGARLDCHDMAAHRILNRWLAAIGVMKIVTKGTRRAAGAAGRATLWQWLHPLVHHKAQGAA